MTLTENADVKVDTSGLNSDTNSAETKPACPEDDQNPNSNSSPKKESTPKTTEVMIPKSHKFSKLNPMAKDFFPKLNPMAKEFFPRSVLLARNYSGILGNGLWFTNDFAIDNYYGHFVPRRWSYGQGIRRRNQRTILAQKEYAIKRTVYLSGIDREVTEEELVGLFLSCGQVVDCRICGDNKSALRFAFVEFTEEDGAKSALSLSGTVFGSRPIKVLPSKTAIVPINPIFLPKSEDEREKCKKTVYCTNIDKNVTQMEVEVFFRAVCGEIQHLRLLGDYRHQTRIAFVEFIRTESAISALSCSGVFLGGLAIRVNPSKTPVKPHPNSS